MSYHHHSRRIPTPGASRKRKERESFLCPLKPSASAQAQARLSANPASKIEEESVCPNRLLAGYMAYEFLTKGTLFGQKFDPARAQAVPVWGGVSGDPRTGKPEAETGLTKQHKSYAEVASILKTDGAHVPGIVNPTQLATWIQR
uniref:Embryo sac development arrest 6 n=1 Tax=Rhizophora mucronata TaxID=61149 RepID=A0A2P2IZG1_RHIMU